MAALDTFRNCSSFTIEQPRVIAHVRGVSAAVCCAILSTVLVVLVILAILPKTRNRLIGTVVKRFSFGLITVSVLYQLDLSLQLVHHYYNDEKFCAVSGFFNQYFGAVQLLFAVGISLALFFKIGQEIVPSWKSFIKKVEEKTFMCYGMKIGKPEVATAVLMIVLPLLFVWIPFVTNSYGPFATWCWIRILRLYSWAHSPQFLHVCSDPQHEPEVDTQAPDVCPSLTAHPKHTYSKPTSRTVQDPGKERDVIFFPLIAAVYML